MEVKKSFHINAFLFVIVFVSYSLAQMPCYFPQDKVDKVCLESRDRTVGIDAERHPSEESLSIEACSKEIIASRRLSADEIVFSDEKLFGFRKRDDLYIGPGETFIIDTNYVQNGNIVVYGDGVLIVDGAVLDLSGHIGVYNQGEAIFQNGAHLHMNQYYVGQYYIWLKDSSRFEANNSTIDANSTMHYVQLHDYSTYVARSTTFPDWTFRKAFNHSSLILEDVYHVGDLIVTDSCYVHYTRCDTFMPWFQTPDGSVIDINFPDPGYVDHFEFSEGTPGVDGIGYTFIADTCWRCWWSLETWPGCSVIVGNSEIRGSCIRIPDNDTFNVYGITNRGFYNDLVVSMQDRHLEYVNTYVYWWNWYALENTVLYIDSCIFGEMIGKGSSETYATRCIHDGSTIMLGSVDSAFVSFVDGESWSYVSSVNYATLLLINTRVIPLWPYQGINIARGNSYVLCVNCSFDSLPFAMDTALVMFAAIDTVDIAYTDDSVTIIGSAWVDAGPLNAVAFQQYKLYWSPSEPVEWTFVNGSTEAVFSDTLGVWDTWGFTEGTYVLRLTVWDDAGDSLTAYRGIVLQDYSIEEYSELLQPRFSVHYSLSHYPIEFSYQIPTTSRVKLKVYDVSGRFVKTLVNRTQPPGLHETVWDGTDNAGKRVAVGIYFCGLEVDESVVVKKLIKLK